MNKIYDIFISILDINQVFAYFCINVIKIEGKMRMVKYLLAHESDSSWGINTCSVGLQVIPPGAQFPYGEHPKKYLWTKEKGRVLEEMYVLYIYQGSGWFVSDHCPMTNVQAGDVIVLFPGEWHNYAPNENTGWEEVWIGFCGDFVQDVFNERFYTVSCPILKIGIRPTLHEAFERAFMIAYEERPAYRQQLAGYVLHIFSSIYAYSKQMLYQDNPDVNCIHLAQKYMREHTSICLNMEEVAKQTGMGYSKFRKLFRNYTGFSPQQYYLKLKLEESKDLLLNSNLSSKEIAFRLGFDSASHFNRIFSKHYRQTPIEFRNTVRK